MIYETVALSEPIHQGDIFKNIPLITFSLDKIPLIDSDGSAREASWQDLLAEDWPEDKVAMVKMKKVDGIVVSQDCDNVNGPFVVIAKIDTLTNVTKQSFGHEPKNIVKNLIRHSRENIKWFYLPEDTSFGFLEKMGADFTGIFSLGRKDLDLMKNLRIGRLNAVADEHFRETIAQYFRRYPYNEWYPLSAEELSLYTTERGPVDPYYDWQKVSAPPESSSAGSSIASEI